VSRRILITAGANGIGLVMARAFAGLGDRVWVTDVDEAAVAALPAGVRGTVCDASSEAAMDLLFAEIEDMPLEGWHQCLGVNLDGAMLCARGAARLMKPAGIGVITFISSTSGLYGTPFRAPYVAAKWGVIGLMKTVAMELGPFGIRANAICPGSVNGPRIDRVIEAEAAAKGMTPDAVRQGYASGTALRRLTDAQDVADMAVYLASDGARMVAGQALAVDGMTYNVDP
jgi:NAD(P)-dependent dehydrogenase (short-subunit alcohol dehydrogenase family)